MPTQPELVLHVLSPSHPCHTAAAALRLKGVAFEEVEMRVGRHPEQMAELYGPERVTVPGLLVDGEPVHGSNAIMARLDELVAEPPLLRDERVAEAARWGDEQLQDLGRRLPWGALWFRPESMGTMVPGGGPLDPAGTDFALRMVRSTWKYHGITAVRLAEDLAACPACSRPSTASSRRGSAAARRPTARICRSARR